MESGEPTVEIVADLVHVFPLQYVQAESLTEALDVVLAGEGRISPVVDENKLIVAGPPSTIRAVAEMLRQIDIPRAQVRITALLFDVSVEEMERLGFNWSKARRSGGFNNAQSGSLLGLESSNFTSPSSSTLSAPAAGAGAAPGAGAPAAGAAAATAVSTALGGWLTLSHISQHFDISAIIQALSTADGTRLLARPNILATDGSAAEFSAVSEIPVQSLTETAEGGSIGTTEFREAGIKLTVTPQIKLDGTIRLEVAPEFSILAGFQDGQPIIDRRTATTVMHMRDGETVVIGGLLRRNDIENQRLFPGSRKWKYLAGLFCDHETTITESELLVIVKAEIIGPEHTMLAREEVVNSVTNQMLEDVPYATYGAFLPSCGDPYCPLHHPHQAYKNHHDEECLQCTSGGYSHQAFDGPVVNGGPPVSQESVPMLQQPARGGPPSPGLSGPDAETESLPSPPQDPVDFEPLGRDLERQPRSNEARAVPANRWSLPPVMIDETARLRRSSEHQFAMRRLPSIDQVAAPAGDRRVTRRLPPISETPRGAAPPSSSAEDDGERPSSADDEASPETGTGRAAPRAATHRSWLHRIFGIR